MPDGPMVTANSVCPNWIVRVQLMRSFGNEQLRGLAGRALHEQIRRSASGCGQADSFVGHSPWLRPQLILRHGLESEQL